MTSRLHLLFVFVALGTLPIRAQDDIPTSRYFRTVGAGVTTDDLYFSPKDNDKNITVSDGFRSILFDGKGNGKLVFYRIVIGSDGKKSHVNVAQADIGMAGSLALLTFFPDPATPGNYIVQVLPDDLTTFPLGSYRVVNRSNQPVKVMVGQQTAEVAPNDIQLLIYPRPSNKSTVVAKIYASGTQSQKLLYADTWGYNDKFRTEILISVREGTDQFLNVARLLDNPSILLMKQYLPKD